MNKILTPAPAAQMLSNADQRLEAIRTAAGLQPEQFDARCMPVLRAYAQHVQNLPFSPKVFSRPQGAWEFGLICATLALQYAGTVIFFPEIKAEDRRILEPQCRYMSFVATLATCAARVTSSTKVVAGDSEYHPFFTPMRFQDWLQKHPDASFLWRDEGAGLSNQGCAVVATRLFPTGLFEHFDLRVVMMFYDAITAGTQKLLGIESTLAKVVRQSIERVIDHYVEKEARVFNESESSLLAAPLDTSGLAKQMAAQANPTLPVNPLAPSKPSAPSSAPHPVQSVAASVNFAAESRHPVATPTLEQPPMHPTNAGPSSGAAPLLGKDPVLREWFAALKLHPRFPDLAKHLASSEEGVLVPINMLGLFGVSGPTIRKKMEEAGFVVRRSDDSRHLILTPTLRGQFIQDEPAAS